MPGCFYPGSGFGSLRNTTLVRGMRQGGFMTRLDEFVTIRKAAQSLSLARAPALGMSKIEVSLKLNADAREIHLLCNLTVHKPMDAAA
jgi:hypothetical protein